MKADLEFLILSTFRAGLIGMPDVCHAGIELSIMNVKQVVYHLNYIHSWYFLFVICYFFDKPFMFVDIYPGCFLFCFSSSSTLYSWFCLGRGWYGTRLVIFMLWQIACVKFCKWFLTPQTFELCREQCSCFSNSGALSGVN